MNNVFFKEHDFPNPQFHFGTKISIEGLGAVVDHDVDLILNALTATGNIVVLKDGEMSYSSIKEMYPDICSLTEYPKENYIVVEVTSWPWPG